VGLLNRGLAQGALSIKFHVHKVNNKNNGEKISSASLRVDILLRGLAQGALPIKFNVHKVNNK
jgi:hypothetical protein